MTMTAWLKYEMSTLLKTRSQSSQLDETVNVDVLSSTHTPGVVHLVGGPVLFLRALPVLRGCLQLPVVQTQQEHFGQLKHGLPFLGSQVAELVLDEVQHSLGGKRESRGLMSSKPMLLLWGFLFVFRGYLLNVGLFKRWTS